VSEPQQSPAERVLRKSLIDDEGVGRPFSERVRQSRRNMEAYLRAGARPRWMDRVIEVDQGIASERRRLAGLYRALQRECGRDRAEFARRWRAVAEAARFDELNDLIRQHNEWYPIERDLPLDPRTGDYVKTRGRSHRRPELGPQWVLEQFPAA
jgi:hypothetical protein